MEMGKGNTVLSDKFLLFIIFILYSSHVCPYNAVSQSNVVYLYFFIVVTFES